MVAGHAQDDVEPEATVGVALREVVEEMDLMGLPSLESAIHYMPNLRQVLLCSKDCLQWMQVACAGDHIPEETVPQIWFLVDGQIDVHNQQRVRRAGPGQRQFGEHFTWRYADHKFKANWFRGFTPVELLEHTPHLCLYLEIMQVAGLIRIFEDAITADPYGRGGSVRFVRAALARSVEHRRKLIVEGLCCYH